MRGLIEVFATTIANQVDTQEGEVHMVLFNYRFDKQLGLMDGCGDKARGKN